MPHNRAPAHHFPPAWPTIPQPAPGVTWPARLAAWRMTNGFTQAGLARALGVRQNTVCRYEIGLSRPGPDVAARFAALAAGGPEAVKRLAKQQLDRTFTHS